MFTVSKAVVEDSRVRIEDVSAGGDGSEWLISYDLRDPNATFVEFTFTYTQEASSNFTIENAHTTYASKQVQAYKEMIVESDGTVTPLVYTVADAGSYFIYLPTGFTSGVCELTIKPDVATGADTLVVSLQEQMEQKRR